MHLPRSVFSQNQLNLFLCLLQVNEAEYILQDLSSWKPSTSLANPRVCTHIHIYQGDSERTNVWWGLTLCSRYWAYFKLKRPGSLHMIVRVPQNGIPWFRTILPLTFSIIFPSSVHPTLCGVNPVILLPSVIDLVASGPVCGLHVEWYRWPPIFLFCAVRLLETAGIVSVRIMTCSTRFHIHTLLSLQVIYRQPLGGYHPSQNYRLSKRPNPEVATGYRHGLRR